MEHNKMAYKEDRLSIFTNIICRSLNVFHATPQASPKGLGVEPNIAILEAIWEGNHVTWTDNGF